MIKEGLSVQYVAAGLSMPIFHKGFYITLRVKAMSKKTHSIVHSD